MADAKFEEAIRLAFETEGTEGIKKAALILSGLGDVSEEVKQQAAGLLDDVANAEKANAAVQRYGEVGASILDYQRKISAARASVLELAKAVRTSEEPTAKQQRDLAKARATLSDLVGEQQREIGQLRTLKTQLDAQGISTRSVAAAQRDLAARTEATRTGLRDLVGGLKSSRDAQAAYQAEMTAAATKGKAEAQQYDAALGKLQHQLDENATAARRGGAEASASLESTRGAVDRLKGALAGLTAYFSFQGLVGGIKSILSTGDQFDRFQKQLTNLYGSADKGEQAFAWAKQFAKDTPLQLDQVMRSFVQLKNFGIDPMSGALQAAVDQNAKLGGESERLERITLAMGQAFAKGKLQGDDIKQMIEAGVPVWKLLAEVTGKSTAELQKMSEAGKLGADVMQKFFAQMGKDAAGAAADQMATLSGQWSNLQDNLQQFEDRVAKKGVLDFFKQQLGALNDQVAAMARDGRLDRYAEQISDGIVRLATAVKSGTTFLVEHAGAIGNVVKAYATFKVARIAGELAIAAAKFADTTSAISGTASAMEGAGKKASLFSRLLGKIPGSVQVAIAVVGFDLLVKAGNYIGELAAKHSEAAKQVEATQQRITLQLRKQAEAYMDVEAQFIRYADTQVLGAREAAKLSDAERAGYAARLQGLQEYLKAKSAEQRRLQQLGEVSQDELNLTLTALKAAQGGMKQLEQGAQLASDALKNKLTVDAEGVREGLVGIGNDATTAQTRIETLFQSFQSDSVTHIGDIALALANVAQGSQQADIAVRNGLQGTLQQLSSTDLLKFQSAATAAFAQFDVSATNSAAVTETVLQTALERLGVSAEQWGLASTDAARQNVAAFQTVAENAAATAGTIEAAFDKAVANATTVQAVQDLGAAMAAAGQQGKVGFDATERAAAAVQNRLRQLQTALDPLNAAFSQLGIQSKRSLDDAAAAAGSAFRQITQAYNGGKASIEDVRAAFAAFAKTQLDAVANADTWKQAQVRSALEVQGATLNLSTSMAALGVQGADSGDRIAAGADGAATSLHHAAAEASNVAEATDHAADSAKRYGEAAQSAAEGANSAWVSHSRTVASLEGLSERFLHDLEALNQYAATPRTWMRMWNDTFGEWRRQMASADEMLAGLNKQNAQYDELSQRIEKLRTQYQYLNDDQLAALAQAQQTLEANQKRAEDDARQKREAAAQAAKDARDRADQQAQADTARWNKELGMGEGAAAPVGKLSIDLNLKHEPAPAGAVPATLSPVQMQQLANEVVRQIGIARTRSNR